MFYSKTPIFMVALATMILSACGGGDKASGPTPEPPSLSLSPNSQVFTCEMGKSYQFIAVVQPSTYTVVWSSSNTTVASVTNGLVSCLATGNATISASASGDPSLRASVNISVSAPVPQVTNLTVKVGFVSGGSSNGLTLRATWSEGSREVAFNGNNTVTLEVPKGIGATLLKIYGSPSYHEATFQTSVFQTGVTESFVIIPKEYTTPMGLGAGQTFAVNVDAMYLVAGNGNSAFLWENPIVGVENFPLRLCANRQASTSAITAEDSAMFYGAVNEHLNAKLGMEVFRPGTFGNNCHVTWAVDSSITSSGLARVGAMAIWATPTHVAATLPGMIQGYLNRTIPHELFHTIGFGHTCGWGSLMSTVGCPAPVNPSMNLMDVAMFHLVREVRLKEREMGSAHSFNASRTTQGASASFARSASILSLQFVVD